MSKTQPHISVCICTYKRPELLKRLLEDLERQDTRGLFTYSIVVAENDESQSAKDVVSSFAAASRLAVKYCLQPERSIAMTRNKAIENADGEFIAFIDDDEFPTEQWLLHLFKACNEHAVAGVLGPVMPHFDKEAPRWIVKAGLFDRPMHPTGLRLNWSQTRTGNVLLRNRLFREEGQRFNPEFLSGSDQEFFKRMMGKGHQFIWCNEAVVYETVPPARWKRGFLIRRAVFRGVFSFRNRPYAPGPIAWSLFAAPAYVLALPVALILGQAKFMSYVFSLSYHIGRLLALVGINPIKQPYVTE
jgi:succinoglycan biosynthesis protein ExoM